VLGAIQEIRGAMPEVVLRTSFIAGFPGETEEEFKELLAFAAVVEFDHAGCFTYSRQPLTPAFDESGQLPDEVKDRRRDDFMRQQQGISRDRARRFVGRTLEALVEGTSTDENGVTQVIGRTFRDAPEVDGLVFARGEARLGAKALVQVEASGDYDLFGSVVPAATRSGKWRGHESLS
jgi:ribosomal protein S12 methylthiotransferase